MCTATWKKPQNKPIKPNKQKTKNPTKQKQLILPSWSKNYGPFWSYQCTTVNHNGSYYFKTSLQDYSLKLSQLRQVLARTRYISPLILAISFCFLWNVRRKKRAISLTKFTEATIVDTTAKPVAFDMIHGIFSPLPWNIGYAHKGITWKSSFLDMSSLLHQIPFWEDRQFTWISRISG